MKKTIKISALVLAILMVMPTLVSCIVDIPEFSTTTKNPHTQIQPGDVDTYSVNVSELTDSSETQPRWLSIPNSRLVLNYYDYATYTWGSFDNPTELEYSSDVTIPLNIGYLDPFMPYRLPEQLLMYSVEDGRVVEADSYSTTWRVDRINYEATKGEHTFAGFDYFYDNNTIVRTVDKNSGTLCICGPYAGGAQLIDGAIVSRTNTYVTAVAVKGAEYKFYGSYDDMMDDYNPSDKPSSSNGWWRCFIDDETSVIAVTVNDVDVSEEDAAFKTLEPLQYDNAKVQAANRENEWNKIYAKIPEPTKFTFEDDFDSMGITEEQVKNKYYQAYAQIISNLLPENPETDFPYKQIATGKGSLWAEGADESIYSAQWESLFAAGFLAFVMPEDAWSVVLGFMSLVDEQGLIGGETLPTNKAQAVWMCYTALSNKEYLAECVEPLEKYITWALDNPRWILGTSHNIPDEKDMDYCSNLLIDIVFLQNIYNELGMTEKAAEWGEKADKYYEDVVTKLFFPENMNEPVQYYFANTGTYKVGSHLRILKLLDTDQLEGEYLEKTMNLANRFYNTEERFMGFDYVKYDEMQYTIYGLIRQGYPEMAANCVQATLREICEAGMLGEEYRGWMRTDENGNQYESVFAQGVRPSMFGAELVIDNVFLLNGFYYHNGGIGAVSLFDKEGGMKNITLNGKTYDITVSGNKLTVNGEEIELEYGKVYNYPVD